MSHSGIEHLALLRTREEDLDEAIDRLARRPSGRAGSRGREVFLQYEFGHDLGRCVFNEMFDAIVGITWSDEDEETGIQILHAEDVPQELERLRGRLLRPRTLARAIRKKTGISLTADLVRALLRRFRNDADPGDAEGEAERLLQAAAQLRRVLERAASKGEAIVSRYGELA